VDSAQRILVVDDELGPRESLRMILKSAYEVTTASTGSEGLRLVRELRPDLVFLDIKMREMNGIEVLKAVKQIDPSIEVVMITAYASFETARDAMAHSAMDYLIKPFGKKEVENAAEKALARRAERVGSRQEVRTLLDRMLTLAESSTSGDGSQDLQQISAGVLESGIRLLQAKAAVLYVCEEPNAQLVCQVRLGTSPHATSVLQGDEWKAWLSQMLADRRPRLVARQLSQVQPDRQAQTVERLGFGAGVFFPVLDKHNALGVLAFFYDTAQPRVDWQEMGQFSTAMMALALSVYQRYHSSKREASHQAQRVAQLSILREISRVIVENLEPQEMFRAISEQLQTGLGYAGFHVWLQDSHTEELREVYGSGSNEGWQPHATRPDIPPDLQVETVDHTQVVIAPVVLDGDTVGAIKLVRGSQQRPVVEIEIELIRMLLDYISIAVKNARLYSEIKAIKSYLENLINDAGDAIITVSTDNRITSWNAAAERIFQYAQEDILRQHAETLFPSEPYQQWRHAVLEAGTVTRLETRLERRNGSPVDVSMTLSPLRGSRDEIIGFSAIVKDVTEDKQLRERLMQSEKLRALGEMAAGVAHNFNNILTTILGRTQLLLAYPEDDERAIQEGLSIVEKATRDAAQVVRRIQTFAQGSSESECVPTDLNQIVKEAVEATQPIWAERARQTGKQVDIEQRLEPIPLVPCRATEIHEVLINLLMNAVDSMPDGGTIRLHSRQQERAVRLEVTDTGVGMTEEVQRRIFDPFFSTKGDKGTGLGLSVSHSLIRGHGGTIEVSSTLNEGTTFVITLPVS
jgi:PAS domain S-box-containing protein